MNFKYSSHWLGFNDGFRYRKCTVDINKKKELGIEENCKYIHMPHNHYTIINEKKRLLSCLQIIFRRKDKLAYAV